MSNITRSSIFVLFILTACASNPGTRPDDMSAAEHREHAQHDESQAGAHEARYDPNASEPRTGAIRASGNSGLALADYEDSEYNPTAIHLGHAEEQREHAAEHLAAAKALESFEEAECKRFRPATRAVCPLLSVVTEVKDVPNGAAVVLANGTSAQAVADHIRCHHAFGRSQHFEHMGACPSYVPGLEVAVSKDGKSVVLTSNNAKEAEQIRVRAHAHQKK
ncbi:MAG: hypothetical protein IPI67_23860 [Myxococcales bacterium]|nr:hypothetical protein [Myxococcales bacterium]